MDIERLTDEHLKVQIKLMQEVLEKREEEKWQEIKPPQRLPSDNWDLLPISELAEDYIKDIWPTGFSTEDYKYRIFLCAIEMMFGNDIFPKIRERQE